MTNPSPYYSLVPKTLGENLAFRKKMITIGSESIQNAREIWLMCSRDILFYVNTMCFTYDPRRDPAALPFITYPFQDNALLALNEAVGSHDILIEKSRDMGASWLCVLIFQWRWQFRDLQSFLMVSRKEDCVDKTDDPDSLFWKIDFIIKNQPKWLQPNFDRTKLLIKNADNESTIAGESTTSQVAIGGRRTGILLDEFSRVENGDSVLSATADVSACRIFNSTPMGMDNAFYRQREKCKLLRMHWTDHPVKAKGLYIQDGKPRSPWYDRECLRRTPVQVAQEMDIDYVGSSSPFFDPQVVQKLIANAEPPTFVGNLHYDVDSLEVSGIVEGDGPLKLWAPLTATNRPQSDRLYSVGVDIAFATGASLSCICVGDMKAGRKIAEFVTSTIPPHTLADIAIAIANWFKGDDGLGAYMIWEANGPGRLFGTQVISRGYRNVWYRPANEKAPFPGPGQFPGFWKNAETGMALLGDYSRALVTGEFIDNSITALRELEMYKFQPNGHVEHCKSKSADDPSGARDNHGDRVIASALCYKAMRGRGQTKKEEPVLIDPGSLAYRRKRAEEDSKADYW